MATPNSRRSRQRHRAALREEVRRWATRLGRTRRAATEIHVGVLGGARLVLPEDPGWDASVRADVLSRLLEDAGRRSVWVVRTGSPEILPADRAWLSAAMTAFARVALAPDIYLITRRSWEDLVDGERREWSRLRPLPHHEASATAVVERWIERWEDREPPPWAWPA